MLRVLLLLSAIVFSLTAKANESETIRDTIVTNGTSISVNAVALPFHQLLHRIARLSGRCYVETITDSLNPVTINIDKVGIYDAVRMATSFEDVEFRITNENIFVYPKRRRSVNDANRHTTTLKGRVIEARTGLAIDGATVSISNVAKTITNKSGEFEIRNVPANGRLTISHVTYNPVNLSYYSELSNPIQMTRRNEALDEIVTNGYSSNTRRESIGNITTFKVDEVSSQPVSNPLMALQGRVPGLLISQNTGISGGALIVVIRGKNSIANGRDPLYIIDGVPYLTPSATHNSAALDPLANLSLEDIEEISVLKDADATAVYGSMAANGVVYITTKRPKPGNTRLQVNIYGGMGKITRSMQLMNTQQYLQMRQDALRNDQLQPAPGDYDLNGKWNALRYTDWQKELIGGYSKLVNARVSLSGGNSLTQFRLSGIYRQETPVYPGKFLNRKRSFRANVDHQSKDQRLRLNFGGIYIYNTHLNPQQEPIPGIFSAPNAPAIYNSAGQLNYQDNTFSNPMAALLRTSKTTIDNLLGNLFLYYQLHRNIAFKSTLGYSLTQLEDVAITPFSSFMPNTDNPSSNRINSTGATVSRNYICEPQFNINFNIGDGRIDIITGISLQQSKGWKSLHVYTGFKNDDLIYNPGAASHINAFAKRDKYNFLAAFTRIGYNLKGKYLVNLTGRRDGSSRFGAKNKFGTFGAIGAAWIFSSEDFFHDNVSFLTYGKLRGSIGITGNDQIPDNRYMSVYDQDLGYSDEPGISAQQLTNTSVNWEKNTKTEMAIELATREGTTANISFYYNYSNNQLLQYSLPGTTGFQSITANLPARVENSGLEFDIRHTILKQKRFSWISDFNITIFKTRLAEFPGLETSSYAFRLAKDYSLDSKFLYNYIGVDKNTGLYAFEDVKKDGALNQYDRIPVSFTPVYYGGWNNTFKYGRFVLDAFFYFVKQKGWLANGPGSLGAFLSSGSNQPVTHLNYWKQPDDDALYQKPSTSTSTNVAYTRYSNSTALAGDASFIRLKSVSLNYAMPEKWLKRLKVSNAKIYMQGLNLFTLTKFNNMDPETSKPLQLPSLPPLRMVTFGFQITI